MPPRTKTPGFAMNTQRLADHEPTPRATSDVPLRKFLCRMESRIDTLLPADYVLPVLTLTLY